MSEQATTEKLAQALREAGAPQEMIKQALAGVYDDFKSDHPVPIVLLVQHARAAGLEDIAQRAMQGDFDATKAESDAWARSPEGQATFRQLMPNRAQRRHKK